jgi:Protein-L-isoaspartate(D-aspartate) O-methyltransferase (PCMT)
MIVAQLKSGGQMIIPLGAESSSQIYICIFILKPDSVVCSGSAEDWWSYGYSCWSGEGQPDFKLYFYYIKSFISVMIVDQLKPGGRMVIPVGVERGSQTLDLIEKVEIHPFVMNFLKFDLNYCSNKF